MKGKRLSGSRIFVVIMGVLVAIVAAALITTNAFVPVKYLSAYTTIAEEKTDGESQVTVVDVGFGECIVVELSGGKVMLIDGGDGEYDNNLNILKVLNARGIDKIDYLICSSVKSEHCGGLTELLNYKQVGKAYIPYTKNSKITTAYYNFYTALTKAGIPYEYSSFGLSECDEDNGWFFTFLSPSDYENPNSEYVAMNKESNKANINNASAVLWLSCGGTNFVFSSDAGTDALKNIVDSYNLCVEAEQPYCTVGTHQVKLEECDVVTVAGHGSDSNTYAAWYDLLSPEKALLSVGKNYSDCPSVQAMADATNCGAKVYMTSDGGNIKIKISNS
jgi:competence protein ComEC